MNNLPILYSVHHASTNFGPFSERTALNDDQIRELADYGAELTVPQHGIESPLIGTHSRGLIDIARNPQSPNLFRREDFDRNLIWKQREEPTREERELLFSEIYRRYHLELHTKLRCLEQTYKPILMVSWDNFRRRHDTENPLPPFILSNKDGTSCSEELFKEIFRKLRSALREVHLPDDVGCNIPGFRGNHITTHYSTLRNPEDPDLSYAVSIHSLLVEYDRNLTHDHEGNPIPDGIHRIRKVFEEVLEGAYKDIF